MKNKKKIIFITLFAVLIIFLIVFVTKNNELNKTNTKNSYNFETINLDWNEIVDIEIDGAEEHSNVILTYNDIPELDNRVNEVLNNWEDKRLKIDLTTEEAQKEYELVGKLTTFKEIQWCTLPDNWNSLSNGDELIITCGNDILKELGYEYDDTITITVDGLLKVVVVEPIKNNVSSDIRDNDNYDEMETEPIQSDTNGNSEINKEIINNDTYYSLGDDIFVSPDNMDNFELQVEDGKRVFIWVDTQTDFQKAKAYALENGNIDYIQIGDQVYDKESNFEESEEWKGLTIAE